MNLKVRWPKFIPLVGVIFVLIDTSWDGDIQERAYNFYHAICLCILVLILKV